MTEDSDPIKVQGNAMMDAILKIQMLTEERNRLVDELMGIAELMLQGVNPQDVESMSFDIRDAKEYKGTDRLLLQRAELTSHPGNHWFTRVTLKGGDVVVLNPPLRRRYKSKRVQ